jgi:penicillin V acylase-like amidase (Ntn superfamily)
VRTRLFSAAMLIVAFALAHQCRACTTFVLSDGDVVLFARNFDYAFGDGIVVVNQRGIEKTALVAPPEKPARWTSRYGSVTFNQFGREMPYGGSNEVGLVVEQMMLLESKYPEPDERPAINMLQWIQYQLDNCRTVEEVIATDKCLRQAVQHGKQRIHYLICDASGDTATIEFLDGKMVYHRGETLAAKALTNDTFQRSVEFMKSRAGDPPPKGRESLHRFARAAECSIGFRSRSPEEDREYAFANLKDVAQGRYTVWSIVYDVVNRKVFYRTHDNGDLRWFSLDAFDYSPSVAPLFLGVNAQGAGNVAADFQELTHNQNRNYLHGFLDKDDVKQEFGDLTPMVQQMLTVLRGYGPATKK